MRILLLSQWFEPEATFKGLAFAKALADRGHEVEVLTGFPNYPEGKVYPGYRVRLWKREVMEGVRVTRVALYPSHDRSALRRVANYASFAFFASCLGVFLVKRPDVVYVYHPPATIILPALMLKLFRRAPFVLDIQDLWPDTLAATGMLNNRFVLGTIGWFCRMGYRSAARIAVLSPGFKRVLAERGVSEDKIEVIFNWCDETAFRGAKGETQVMSEPVLAGRFNVVFAGNMGRAQALAAVLQAARLVAERASQVQFLFVGPGIEVDSLREEAACMDLANVRFLPALPAAKVGPLLAAADILLVHLKDDPLFSITVPSKTQAYLAVGRPILMAVKGDAADIVKQAGAGLACLPESPQAISDAVLELAAMSPDALWEMGQRGCRFYQEKFSFSVGVGHFDALLRAAAGRRGQL